MFSRVHWLSEHIMNSFYELPIFKFLERKEPPHPDGIRDRWTDLPIQKMNEPESTCLKWHVHHGDLCLITLLSNSQTGDLTALIEELNSSPIIVS